MGQITQHETTIDGVRYRTKTLDAITGIRILPRLLSILPPGVAEIVLTVSEEDRAKICASPETMLSMMQIIARAANDGEGLQVVVDLVGRVEFEHSPPESNPVWQPLSEWFGTHFAGDYYRLLKVAWWAARASFSKP